MQYFYNLIFKNNFPSLSLNLPKLTYITTIYQEEKKVMLHKPLATQQAYNQ